MTINTFFIKNFFLRFKLKYCLSIFILILSDLPLLSQNFTTITWGTAASQKYAVTEAQGKVVNGKLYSFGGFDSQKSTWTPTKRAYVYNPVINMWSAIADLPHTPNGAGFGGVTHAGITTNGNDIFIAGGYTSNTAGTGQTFGTKQVWKYIISRNVYTRLPDLPVSIAAGQLEYLSGKLHYIGGTNTARTIDLGYHYVLDLNNLAGGWKTLASLPNPRQHAGSAVYRGKIYFIGGQHHHDSQLTTQKDVHVFDPINNSWSKLADLPVPSGANGRAHISSGVVVMGERIIVLGGEIAHQSSINMVSAFSPATNSWKNLTPLPKSRFSGVAGVMEGNIYYTGGSKSNTTFKGIPATTTNTYTLSAIADAFVRNGKYAGVYYGKDTSLDVKGSTVSDYTRLSYLKFSLNSVSNISSAKLRIYGRNTDNTTSISVSLFGVNNDSWTESGISYNNAPAVSTSALSSAGITNQAKYYELDVTNYVKSQFAGDKIVSFLIKDATNQNKNLVFNSRENTRNKPQLVITSSANRTNNISDNQVQAITSAEDILSIEKDLKKPVVYPNPVQKRFSIKFPVNYEGNFYIEIVDLGGRIYSIGTIRLQSGGSNINVDISKFSFRPGVYFLKLHSDKLNEKMKLIIQ